MKSIKLSFLAVALMASLPLAQADMKIGVVSLQTVFQQVPQGQASVDQMKQQLMPQMNQIKKDQSSLSNAVSAFNKNSPMMSAKDRDSEEATLTQQQQQFQQEVDTFRTAESQKQQAAAQAFQSSLVAAIQTVAKNGSYDMVMTDQTVPYFNPKFDVSPAVINLMKKMGS